MNYYRAALQYPDVVHSLEGNIYVPTLIIWGTDDKALTREIPELSSQYVKNYKCQIELLEGGSHWIQQERPQEVNKCMRDFLDQPLTSLVSKL